MKTLLKRVLSLIFVFIIVLSFCACEKEEEFTGYDNLTLRICNWEDYIYEDEETEKTMWEDFEEWYEEQNNVDITIEYSTFGTPEILYNNLKINEGCYDLICPSDYMIQKMKQENMLETFDVEKDVPNYYNYASNYIKDLFDKNEWSDIALPYMWGTMGFIYNPEYVTHEEASTWACSTNQKFFNKTTIKDSVRDTYFLGVGLAKREELNEKNTAFNQGLITLEDYQGYLANAFNDTTQETVDKVEGLLKEAKRNAFSIEVDSGKDDMITGKVWLNFAWSGDAYYAMYEAEDLNGVTLNYAVPKEGSNIWFDGWCMPKGANKKLACAFLDYISSPENAWKNMEYIGYTSPIAGQEVFDNILATYDVYSIDPEEGEEVEEINPEDVYAVDLSYYFGELGGEKAIVHVTERNRLFDAQYPDEEIINRCTIMQCFSAEEDKRVNTMWNRVKAGEIDLYLIVIGVSVLLFAIVYVGYILYKKDVFAPRPPKGYKRIA